MFGLTFFDNGYVSLCNVYAGVVFFSEASWDPEAWFVVVSIRVGLLVALSVHGVSLGLSVIMSVGFCICIEDT